MRYTIKDARKAFQRLLVLLDRREAASYKDVGGWQLDYAPIYGGVIVEEISTETGGVFHPLNHSRMSCREFCQSVEFLSNALRIRQ